MNKWTPVNDKEKYGVVISNFLREDQHYLSLNVGDTVYIYEENDDWYYGSSTKERHKNGVVPKNYIKIRDAVIDKTGLHEVIIPREPPIIQEITSVLREWGVIWKQLYINNSPHFEAIRIMMNVLIDWRRQILSGTLPVDEMKELKKKVTEKIDFGNAILGLDLVVRDENGNILNPDITNTIDLFRAHEAATNKLKQMTLDGKLKGHGSPAWYSHNFHVTIKNFVCRIGEDADILVSLYDAKKGKFISENYLVKWAKEGLAKELDLLNNLRILFTDLGSKDLIREKVFLVCQVIRIGLMELKETDKRLTYIPKRPIETLRRPFGIAAMDVTDIISGKIDTDEEKQYFIPFIHCGEKDFLDTLIRKAVSAKEVSQRDHKGQGFYVCMKLMHGDLKQVKDEFPHLVSSSTCVARKMGFPEVILPGDVRNDLYLTLVQGEFSKGGKSSDKNVEVSVSVCNEKGQLISGVMSYGAGSAPFDIFKSVIYYHEDKPKWMETIKIALPIDDFYNAHLKFTFKHRSSNEAKDKSEKPFALSYVKLMQENETALKDEVHDLAVYKIDHKKIESDPLYLKLPSTWMEVEYQLSLSGHSYTGNSKAYLSQFQCPGLTLSSKDIFSMSTIICSTKLTQNVDLLGLLKWWDTPEHLKKNLLALMKVDGEEIVKFLQDTLDALFNILMKNSDSEHYDELVFEALVFIIGLVSDRKYQHFRPVLDLYIQENFSATLAYNKLIFVLKKYVDNANTLEGQEFLLKAMKSLEYIIKFIVKSRALFSNLNEGKGKQQFEISLKQLLSSLSGMMLYTSDSTLLVQGACLKFIPYTIRDVLLMYDPTELSYVITDIINNVPVDRLTKQKMMCVNDVVFSDLFKYSECRGILLPVFNDHLRLLLERNEEVELCIRILSDILVVLNCNDFGPTHNDIKDIMLSILRTIIQSVIAMERDSSLVGNLVSVMLDILKQMTPYHYSQYIANFPTKTDLLDFLMEILMVFKDLVSKNVCPKDWNEMIMLQNSIILKSLRFFAQTIREHFLEPFESQVWNNFFHCAIAFLTQDALQLERFSVNKRNKILSRYKDMRRETGFEIRTMWFSLGTNKLHFVPEMVGPFLEMTLIPEIELRKATIPIFFDMMSCEFYSVRSHAPGANDDFYINNRDIKGNFKQFEDEMVTQLDMLVEGGRGDEEYKDLFFEM